MDNYSVEAMKFMGYEGYQKDMLTGDVTQTDAALEYIAEAMSSDEYSVNFRQDLARHKVIVCRNVEDPAIPAHIELYAERDMTDIEKMISNERMRRLKDIQEV